MSNIERYIVYIPNQEFRASYNAALGENALMYAKITAKRFFGKITIQYKDGSFKDYKDYGEKQMLNNSS